MTKIIVNSQGKAYTFNNKALFVSGGGSLVDFVNAVYPVGALYFGNTSTCPLASITGTWTLVSSGKAIMGADNDHAIGTTATAGLPNIQGTLTSANLGWYDDNHITSGAFVRTEDREHGYGSIGSGQPNIKLVFDASNSSSIYGNSSTVQPPAYYVNIWERTA